MLVVPSFAAATILPSETAASPLSEWQPEESDTLIIDTASNVGYLVHNDGAFTEFPVATGQKRIVRYIGRTYNARTPPRKWAILSEEIKGDRTTFGKRGIFLRLHDVITGEETPYGIHSHRSAKSMLSEEDRYRSMGCIIVSDDLLDVLRDTYAMNGNALMVLTTDGLPSDIPSLASTILRVEQADL